MKKETDSLITSCKISFLSISKNRLNSSIDGFLFSFCYNKDVDLSTLFFIIKKCCMFFWPMIVYRREKSKLTAMWGRKAKGSL